MAKITYNEGEAFILSSLFQGTPATFGPFHVGLGTGPAPLNEATTLTDLDEIVGSGYVKATVQRNATTNGWTLNGPVATSPILTFANTSLDTIWPAVDFIFLCATASPSVVPNVLISAVDLPDSLFIAPGQSFDVIFKFRLKDATFVGEAPLGSTLLAAPSLEVSSAEVSGSILPGFSP